MEQILVNRVVKEVDGQSFEFHMPINANLGVAYDVLYEMFTVIGKNIEANNKKAAEEALKFKEAEKAQVEEVTEEQ